MRRTRNTKLNLLSLEDRLTPAVTVTPDNGNLLVDGGNGDNTVFIFVHATTTDVFVADEYIGNAGGQALDFESKHSPVLTFSLTGNIIIRQGNGTNATVLTIDDNEQLPGDFVASLGKGNNDVQIQTRNNAQATILGQVHIRSGNGADNVFMFDTIVEGKTTISGGIGGTRTETVIDPSTKLPVTHTVSNNVFQVSNCTFDSDVAVVNFATMMDHFYGPNEINGNLRVTQMSELFKGNFVNLDGLEFPAGAKIGDPGTYAGFLLIDGKSDSGNINVVNGNVFFGGTRVQDGAFLNGEVNGNVKVIGNDGNDNFALGDVRFPYYPTINGNLTIKGGKDADTLSIRDLAFIDGTVDVDLGNGNNTYDLNHSFEITGTVKITGGSGTDNVGTIGGTIGGNVTVHLGDGDNNVDFAFSGFGLDIDYLGGTGVDNVQLSGNYNLFHGVFGDGNDTFQYGALATLDDSFFGDFGNGTDTYIKNGVDDSQWSITRISCEQVLS